VSILIVSFTVKSGDPAGCVAAQRRDVAARKPNCVTGSETRVNSDTMSSATFDVKS